MTVSNQFRDSRMFFSAAERELKIGYMKKIFSRKKTTAPKKLCRTADNLLFKHSVSTETSKSC